MKLRYFPAILLLLFGLQLLTTSASLIKLRPPTIRPAGPDNWQDVMGKNHGNLSGKDRTGVIRLRPDGTNANDCGDEPCPADDDINLIRSHDNNDDDVDTDQKNGDLDDDVHTDETEIDIVQVDMDDLANTGNKNGNGSENADDNDGDQNVDDFSDDNGDQSIDTDDTVGGTNAGDNDKGTEPEIDIIEFDNNPNLPDDGTQGNGDDFKGVPEVNVADVPEPSTTDEGTFEPEVDVIEVEADTNIPEEPAGSGADDTNLNNNPDNVDRHEDEDDIVPEEDGDVSDDIDENVNANVNGQDGPGQEGTEIDVFEDESDADPIDLNTGANVDTIDENDERNKAVDQDNGATGPSEVDTAEGDHVNDEEPPMEENQFVDQVADKGQDPNVDTFDESDDEPEIEVEDDGVPSDDNGDEVEVLNGDADVDTDFDSQNQNQNQGDVSDDDDDDFNDYFDDLPPEEQGEFDDPNITIIPNDDPAWSNID